jgi:hypothetical protein
MAEEQNERVAGALRKGVFAGLGGASLVFLVTSVGWDKGPYLASKPRVSELLFAGVTLGAIAVVSSLLTGAAERKLHSAERRSRVMTGAMTDVFRAQLGLAKLGYGVEPNGVLDGRTVDALKRFQATYSLQRMDGSVNPETLAYLDAVVKQQASAADPATGLHPAVVTYT